MFSAPFEIHSNIFQIHVVHFYELHKYFFIFYKHFKIFMVIFLETLEYLFKVLMFNLNVNKQILPTETFLHFKPFFEMAEHFQITGFFYLNVTYIF